MIFNRPDTTRKVFDAIRKAEPRELFLIADGPRANVPGEFDKCEMTKKIVENIDWDCKVYRDYSDVNLGCGKRISTGISWVFSKVDEAIFLEDDCLPHPSFFRFCSEMLDYYKHDERIMFISGDNFQFNRRQSQSSYYFSSFSHVWGWATWKRVWDKYDFDMQRWPYVNQNNLLGYWLSNPKSVKWWTNLFNKVYNKEIDTWDIQLVFTCWINSGLSITPEINLVSNIGFGAQASHTADAKHRSSNLPAMEITFPLKHPAVIMRDPDADSFEEKTHFLYSFPDRLVNKVKKTFNL